MNIPAPCCDENGFMEVAVHHVQPDERRAVLLVMCCCDCRRGQDRQQMLAAEPEDKRKKSTAHNVPLASEFANTMLNRSTVLAVYPRPTWFQRAGFTEEPRQTPAEAERWQRWASLMMRRPRDPLPERSRYGADA